jgi:hypothetical protein
MTTLAYSLINKVCSFINDLFKHFRTTDVKPEVQPEILPEVQLEVRLEAPVAVEPRQPRKYDKEKKQDFSDLLDRLEHTFNNVKLPTMSGSWIPKDSVVGLKKLGVHVPNPFLVSWDDETKVVDVTKPLPAIMCISASCEETINTKKKFFAKFVFAIKMKKLPWHVSQASGVPYQFGMSFDYRGKLLWVNMYITVNRKTGVISFCDELRTIAHTVPAKNPNSRKANGQSSVFYKKSWSPAEYLEDEERSIAECKVIAQNYFVAAHDWWSERENRWNVIVKKNGDRVTFGVNNDQTPYYFKDRDKSIRTPSGQAKKIVHYVKEHERKYGDKTTIVKEHIRGLQEFEWAGYECHVVSPRLQAGTAATFTAASTMLEDDQETSELIYLSKLGKILADNEERQAA